MDCLFCKMANKHIGAHIVYEDDKTFAFLDAHPRSPGHTVIIPKIHAENILDLPDGEAGPLFLTVKKVTAILNKAFLPTGDDPKGQNPQGFTIGINHGRTAGQVVDHLHIHVIPRFMGDGGSGIHGVVNNLPKQTLEEIITKIKKT